MGRVCFWNINLTIGLCYTKDMQIAGFGPLAGTPQDNIVRAEVRRVDEQPQQVQVNEKILTVLRLGLNAHLREATHQKRQCLIGRSCHE